MMISLKTWIAGRGLEDEVRSSQLWFDGVWTTSGDGMTSKHHWAPFPTWATNGMMTPEPGYVPSDRAIPSGLAEGVKASARFHCVDRCAARTSRCPTSQTTSKSRCWAMGLCHLHRGNMARPAARGRIHRPSPHPGAAFSATPFRRGWTCGPLEALLRRTWSDPSPSGLPDRFSGCRSRSSFGHGQHRRLPHVGTQPWALASRQV